MIDYDEVMGESVISVKKELDVDVALRIVGSINVLLGMDGFKSVIAGGFPRDVYFNRTPKDIDLWVYGSDDVDATFDMYAKVVDQVKVDDDYVASYWFEDRRELGGFEEPSSDAVGCEYALGENDNYGIIKTKSMIDIIFTKVEGWRNPIQFIVDNFDYNINEFAYIDGKVWYFGNQNLFGLLVSNFPGGGQEKHRKEKMEKYAKEVGWAIQGNYPKSLLPTQSII